MCACTVPTSHTFFLYQIITESSKITCFFQFASLPSKGLMAHVQPWNSELFPPAQWLNSAQISLLLLSILHLFLQLHTVVLTGTDIQQQHKWKQLGTGLVEA